MRCFHRKNATRNLIVIAAVMTITACSPIAVTPDPTVAPTSLPPTETPITPSPWPTQKPTVNCNEATLREAVAAGGNINLSRNCVYHLTADLPPLTADVHIFGNNAVIDGGGLYAVFFSQNTDIELDDLTIQNAYHDSHSPAIYAESGDIEVFDASFVNNQAEFNGGAIGVGSWSGSILIWDSEFRGNGALLNGGAISSYGSGVDVERTLFIENTSVGCGAAIYINDGSLWVYQSAFIDNEVTVHGGGALCSTNAYLEILTSTFSGNRSVRGGGAIAAVGGNSEITACTITNNTAGRGGGIWADGSVAVEQSIIAGNNASTADDIIIEGDLDQQFISLGYNLIGDPGNLLLEETDIVNPEARLGPLVNYGHLPLAGSPALDAIPSSECLFSGDQYGHSRPRGAGCDIGAVER